DPGTDQLARLSRLLSCSAVATAMMWARTGSMSFFPTPTMVAAVFIWIRVRPPTGCGPDAGDRAVDGVAVGGVGRVGGGVGDGAGAGCGVRCREREASWPPRSSAAGGQSVGYAALECGAWRGLSFQNATEVAPMATQMRSRATASRG